MPAMRSGGVRIAAPCITVSARSAWRRAASRLWVRAMWQAVADTDGKALRQLWVAGIDSCFLVERPIPGFELFPARLGTVRGAHKIHYVN